MVYMGYSKFDPPRDGDCAFLSVAALSATSPSSAAPEFLTECARRVGLADDAKLSPLLPTAERALKSLAGEPGGGASAVEACPATQRAALASAPHPDSAFGRFLTAAS